MDNMCGTHVYDLTDYFHPWDIGDGPTACSSWFRRYPEYKKALGRPHSDAREVGFAQTTTTLRAPTAIYLMKHELLTLAGVRKW
eukprot:m.904363 g.904363  ORF g.904363 m.904363 type:complete len:84 (+) comp23695_c0_seq20:1176-1427(+)